jgi:hypothetical protein
MQRNLLQAFDEVAPEQGPVNTINTQTKGKNIGQKRIRALDQNQQEILKRQAQGGKRINNKSKKVRKSKKGGTRYVPEDDPDRLLQHLIEAQSINPNEHRAILIDVLRDYFGCLGDGMGGCDMGVLNFSTVEEAKRYIEEKDSISNIVGLILDERKIYETHPKIPPERRIRNQRMRDNIIQAWIPYTTIEKLEYEINELINNLTVFLNNEYPFNREENEYFKNYLRGNNNNVDGYQDLPNINELNVNIDNLSRELSRHFFHLMTMKSINSNYRFHNDILKDRVKNQNLIDEYLTKIFELKKQIKKFLATAQLSIREKLTRGDTLPIELVKKIEQEYTNKTPNYIKGGKRKSRKQRRKSRKSKKSCKSKKSRKH